MINNSWLKQLDTVLSTSFSNLKYDIREIYRLINEIKNILIEAEPLEVRQRITVIENSLQDHVASMKTIENTVSDIKGSMKDVKSVKPADNKELVAVFRDVKTILVQNQKGMEKLSKNVEKVIKNDTDRKKDIKELQKLAKQLEREVKKKPKVVVAKQPKPTVSKTSQSKTTKTVTRQKKIPYISDGQFQAKRKGDLNSEWIEVTGTRDMTGYSIQDRKRKHTYNFPKGFVLDGKVKIHTGKGKDTKTQLYWDNPTAVWNDLSDVAVLKNKKKVIISRARSEKVHNFEVMRSNDKVNITSVQFEGAGSERDANGEWIEVTGTGRMGGFTLEDKNKKHVYTFPTGFVLNGKAKVYSGRGKDTETKLFWGNPNPVWNDDHDVCTLKNREGKVLSQIESRAVHNFEILK